MRQNSCKQNLCPRPKKKKTCRTVPWQKHCTQEGWQVNYVRHDNINETDDRKDHQPLAQSQNYWKTVNWSLRQQCFRTIQQLVKSLLQESTVALLELLSSSRQTILKKTIQNHWIAPGKKGYPAKSTVWKSVSLRLNSTTEKQLFNRETNMRV